MDRNSKIDELPRDTADVHQCKEKIPLPPGKKFHIFFSYRDILRDKLWVRKLVKKLETEYGYTCRDHERDFLPGTNTMENIKDGLKNSEKVVVVFSKEAIDSHYVLLEAALAYKQSLETRKNLLIPVLLDDCNVPEEYMLLTYIDAREGVEEATWFPKLLKSLESTGEASRSPFYVEGKNAAAGKEFAITQLCSIETKYDLKRRSIRPNSKYIPEKLRQEAFAVPVYLIRATYRNLLRSPRVESRQKSYFLARPCVVIGYLIFALFLFYFILGIYYITQPKECISFFLACIFLLSLLGHCYLPYKLIYAKNPRDVHFKIIDYNKILSKYGVQVTVVHGYMWKTASLIFYKCKFVLCQEYVIRHLVKEDIPNSDRNTASADNSSLLSGVGKQFRSREKKAMDLLMWHTPKYLDLAYANKLKNPKEDRHGIEFKCLCQYLEEVDENFREEVKWTKSLRSQIDIEENYQDEANIHFQDISLE